MAGFQGTIAIGIAMAARAAYRDGWKIYSRAAPADEHIAVAEGWLHYDLYDKPEPVAIALAKVVPFFKVPAPAWRLHQERGAIGEGVVQLDGFNAGDGCIRSERTIAACRLPSQNRPAVP